VAPVISGAPAPGWSVRSVTVEPVAVTVRGPLDAVATMTSIATEPIALAGRSADLTTTVDLVTPAGVEVVDGGQVRVVIDIAADRGSRSFGVGLRPTGAVEGRSYAFSVPDVLVTLGGTSAALDVVDPATLSATVPVAALEPGSHTVKVVFKAPSGTSLVAISPASVTVVVTAGSSQTPIPSPTPGP
jgi:YbbR domain-containing protein